MSADADRTETVTVGDLGELELLRRILAILPAPAADVLGAGDDAAVVPAPDGRFVVTTDLMIEVPDFRRYWSRADELGRKAIVSNAADVAAMGAVPTSFVIGLVLPPTTPVSWVDGFATGVRDGVARFAPGAAVVGGDLSTGERIAVAVTAFGDLEGRAPVVRSGARPGDVVALAGSAGRSAAGLAALLRADADPDGTPPLASVPDRLRALGNPVAELIDQHLAPVSPLAAGAAAAIAGATAMMDVSDGLLLDATRLARASGVGIDVDPDALAPDVQALLPALALAAPEFAADVRAAWATDLVLTGGEDHALLATFPAGATLPAPFRRIGTVGPAPSDDRTAAERAAGTAAADESATVRVTVAGAARSSMGWDPYAAGD